MSWDSCSGRLYPVLQLYDWEEHWSHKWCHALFTSKWTGFQKHGTMLSSQNLVFCNHVAKWHVWMGILMPDLWGRRSGTALVQTQPVPAVFAMCVMNHPTLFQLNGPMAGQQCNSVQQWSWCCLRSNQGSLQWHSEIMFQKSQKSQRSRCFVLKQGHPQGDWSSWTTFSPEPEQSRHADCSPWY